MAAVRAGADMATAAAAAGPAAGQAPPTLNFADLITTAASGLAGGAAPRAGGDPPGQSFEERLRAATERGEKMNIVYLPVTQDRIENGRVLGVLSQR